MIFERNSVFHHFDNMPFMIKIHCRDTKYLKYDIDHLSIENYNFLNAC